MMKHPLCRTSAYQSSSSSCATSGSNKTPFSRCLPCSCCCWCCAAEGVEAATAANSTSRGGGPAGEDKNVASAVAAAKRTAAAACTAKQNKAARHGQMVKVDSAAQHPCVVNGALPLAAGCQGAAAESQVLVACAGCKRHLHPETHLSSPPH